MNLCKDCVNNCPNNIKDIKIQKKRIVNDSSCQDFIKQKENKTMKRYLAVSKEAGVFLGTFLGMAFFSDWDSVGQDSAPTFKSIDDAKELLKNLTLQDMYYVEIEANEDGYIHSSEMPKYGLYEWEY